MVSRFLVLATAIFIFFAFLLWGILFGTNTQNSSTAYAVHFQQNILENEGWRNDLGLSQCPDITVDKWAVHYCKDKSWVLDCMLRDMSHDPGKSEGDAWGNGDCAAGGEVSWDLWNNPTKGIRDLTINSCHKCIDWCWYNWQLTGQPSYQDCINSGGPGLASCKADVPTHSFNTQQDDNKDVNWSCALPSWISSWQYPTGQDAVNKSCTYACRKNPTNDNVDPDCFGACIKNSPETVMAWIKDPKNGANNSQQALQQVNSSTNAEINSVFNFKDIPSVNFDPIPGGFGWGAELTIPGFIKDVWSVGSIVFGGLAVLKIVFGGVMYATAAGNAQRISSAKEHILYALIGLILIILVNVILTILGVGPEGHLPTS